MEHMLVQFADDTKLDDQLIHLRAGLPFRQTQTGRRNGLTGTF